MARSSSDERDQERKIAGVTPAPQDFICRPAISLAARPIFSKWNCSRLYTDGRGLLRQLYSDSWRESRKVSIRATGGSTHE